MGLIRWFKRLFGLPAGEGRGPAAPFGPPPVPRLTIPEALNRVRSLSARNGQWPEIWSQLNPTDDPVVRQLLLDLRNDGLQFAPTDGLSKIEQACLSLSGDMTADVVAVLKKALGRDVLDKFK